MRRRSAAVSALSTLLAGPLTALVLLGAPPAVSAQAGGPQIAVEAVHPLGGGSFHFIVDLADTNGDPITGTTVTATPTSPSGSTGAAVMLPSSGDGLYQGPVPLPDDGTWTVKVASADPATSIDYRFEVDGDTGTPVATAPPTTAAPTTAAPTATTTPATTVAASTTVATTPASSVTETERAGAADTGDDDSGFPMALVVIAAALVALAGVPLALRTIRNATDGGPDDPGGPNHPGGPGAPTATGPRISD
jgi:hypothetical protein